MAQFPNLEMEPEVQENDRTRLSAAKSFVSKGSTAISTVTIKPDQATSAISVYDATDNLNWYLDWEYSFPVASPITYNFDIVSNYNDRVDYLVGTTFYSFAVGTHTYSTSQIATSLETSFNTTSAGNNFLVTFDADTNTFTISAATGFILLGGSGRYATYSLLNMMGYRLDTDSQVSHESAQVDAGFSVATLTIGDGTTTTAENRTIKVIRKDWDKLFSGDGDLIRHEPDILRWVPQGRNSFLDIHRRAQTLILDWLDQQGYVNINLQKYTKFDFIDVQEVKIWSTYLTLRLIFEGLSNAVDDIFAQKALRYKGLEEVARQRVIVRLDVDNDKKVDNLSGEGLEISPGWVIRR